MQKSYPGHKFVTEIDPNDIAKQKVIGVGEFGEVSRGVVKTQGRGEVTLAIKTLKPGDSEKQMQYLLSKASIMGQFSYPNIIQLEGVVTNFKHALIVKEYMENGALLRIYAFKMFTVLNVRIYELHETHSLNSYMLQYSVHTWCVSH
uniref:Protein kinase domain-containing protein n=1 Tax=Oryzias latipes TaxID=8090 RepID=A0A3P9JXM9_ORYLA